VQDSRTPAAPARSSREATGLRPRSRLGEGAVWLLLLGATSPVLSDLARHLAAEPWALYSLVFWALFLRELARRPAELRPRPWGYALLALALALQLVMLRAGWPRIARPAVGLAALGLALALGHPRPSLALTALLAVPAPSSLVEAWSPGLERAVAHGASWALGLIGVAADVTTVAGRALLIRTAEGNMRLEPSDGGLPLAALLGGLGWYAGARLGLPPTRLLAHGAAHALLAAPLQLAGAVAAIGACAGGAPRAARVLLTFGPALGALAVVWVLARRRRSTAAGPVETPLG
jgi:hypothetical protein